MNSQRRLQGDLAEVKQGGGTWSAQRAAAPLCCCPSRCSPSRCTRSRYLLTPASPGFASSLLRVVHSMIGRSCRCAAVKASCVVNGASGGEGDVWPSLCVVQFEGLLGPLEGLLSQLLSMLMLSPRSALSPGWRLAWGVRSSVPCGCAVCGEPSDRKSVV